MEINMGTPLAYGSRKWLCSAIMPMAYQENRGLTNVDTFVINIETFVTGALRRRDVK
jgi:hypothetical protein